VIQAINASDELLRATWQKKEYQYKIEQVEQ
jgi:hypothetical protein